MSGAAPAPRAGLPPLVEPGPPLTREQLQRYARNLTVPQIGEDGQRRIRTARVLCLGAGGLGSPALLYLAAAGIGALEIVDDDVVERSNLQRQVIHAEASQGRSKAESAAARVQELNPEVRVRVHRTRLTAQNAVELVSGCDLVLDGADSFPTRYVLSDACEIAGIPHVWGSILRFDGQLAVFWGAHGPTYRDLHPVPPAPGSVPNCAEAGVLGALPGVIGSAMALEALKLITGAGRPLVGRVSVHDALDGTWETLDLHRAPGRAPITRMHPFGSAAADGYGLDPHDAAAEVCAAAPAGARDGAAPRSGPGDALDFVELQEFLDRGHGVLIDVREPWEHRLQAIPGAQVIPLGEFRSGAAFARIDRETPVVLHCQAGVRSAEALELLRAHDAQTAGAAGAASSSSAPRWSRHLAGGIAAWSAAGLPTT